MHSDLDELFAPFLAERGLPSDYLQQVRRWLVPLSAQLVSRCQQHQSPLIVGLSGCQGSGKSTAAAALALLSKAAGLRVAVISLDDFYLSRSQRAALAKEQHPLFTTRGVPGTHDLTLALRTLNTLRSSPQLSALPLPRFDKASDEPKPREEWPLIDLPVDMVLFEGWCLGAQAMPKTHPDLLVPCNELERLEDPDSSWRRRVNDYLAEYQALFAIIDFLLVLQAPSFDCVLPWRSKQERKLQRAAEGNEGDGVMNDAALTRFVQHFERLSRHCLVTLPERADIIFELDDEQRISARRDADY